MQADYPHTMPHLPAIRQAFFKYRFKDSEMKYTKLLTASAIALMAASAHAGIATDAHGNIGYDTAAECDAAVQNGTAKFYQSATHQKPLLHKGEHKVVVAKLADLGPQYALGACDLGVGRKFNRDGVAKALQGKYVPYSPEMAVNVYSDAQGRAVRATMQQCDNRFSGNAPRPVPVPAPKPAPVAVPAPQPVPVPAAEPVKAESGIKPYVFGTIGADRDGYKFEDETGTETEHDTRFAGQAGLGVQFNDLLGLEAFYQGGQKHRFGEAGDQARSQNHTYGARATVGGHVSDKFRLFGKAGVAGVKHKITDSEGFSTRTKTKARPTVGVGASYDLTDNLALRADYDYYFRKKENVSDTEKFTWKANHYLGAGLQYNF